MQKGSDTAKNVHILDNKSSHNISRELQLMNTNNETANRGSDIISTSLETLLAERLKKLSLRFNTGALHWISIVRCAPLMTDMIKTKKKEAGELFKRQKQSLGSCIVLIAFALVISISFAILSHRHGKYTFDFC